MSLEKMNHHCYYYKSAVNVGYIHHDSIGLMIDTGIDSSSIKKVLRELTQRGLPVTHLLITHAHADHYGGAAYLQDKYKVHTLAPPFEEAILRNPKLEPLYLFGGNDPVDELQNKFLQGPPVRIDELVQEGKIQIGPMELEAFALPGHSYHQVAVRVHGVLYAADGYFGEEMLKKHKIPYITDADLTLQSLMKLQTIECEGAVPGHGVFESDPKRTVDKNIKVHQKILQWLFDYINEHEQGVTHEQVVAGMCQHYGVKTPQLSQWLLYRTTVTAYLIALKKEGKVVDCIQSQRWTFFPASNVS